MGKIDINSKCNCGRGKQGALKLEEGNIFANYKSGWSEKHQNATIIHKAEHKGEVTNLN